MTDANKTKVVAECPGRWTTETEWWTRRAISCKIR